MIKNFQLVLDSVLAELAELPEVADVLFSGSVQRGEVTPTSDLDLFVVVEGDQCWSNKRRVCGVEVETYFFPARQWRENLDEGHAPTIKAFATGAVLLDRKGKIAGLVTLAKKLWADGPQPLSPLQVNNWRIRITELISDLEGLPPDTPVARLLSTILVNLSLEGYCALHRVWADKPEHLIRTVSAKDPELGRQVVEFYQAGALLPEQAIGMAEQVLEPFGGRLMEYEGPRVPCEACEKGIDNPVELW